MKDNSPELWSGFLRAKQAGHHKYDYGAGLVYADREMTGASILASQSALRCGLGLLTISADHRTEDVFRISVPEALIEVRDNGISPEKLKFDHICIGQGLKTASKTLICDLIEETEKRGGKCILDAGALTAFSEKPEELFAVLHENCILTPHEGEYRKLFGSIEGTKQIHLEASALKAGCTIILKGSETLMASPDKETISNMHATPWLATGGTGDVLSGILLGLAGLCGKEIHSHYLAAMAVWIHGESSVRCEGVLVASDLIAHCPDIISDLIAAKRV